MPDDSPNPEDVPVIRPALIADAPPDSPADAPPDAPAASAHPTEAAAPPRSRTPYYLAGCAVLLVVVVAVAVVVVGIGGAGVAVLGAGALALVGSVGALLLFGASAPDPAIAPQDVPGDVPVVTVTATASSEAPHREAGTAVATRDASAASEPAAVAVDVPTAPPVETTPAEDAAPAAPEEDWLTEAEPARAPVSAPAPSPEPAETKPRPVVKLVTGVTTEVRLGKDQPVGVEGDAVVVLVGASARYPLPGSAPPGRYDIEATFPGEPPLVAGKITVGLGGNAVVVCNTNMGICRAK